MSFRIQTDHKPLVPLFSSKNLEELPLRVQRFRMRMMCFQFTISHVPGKELTIADALSRAPVCTHSERDELLHIETTAYVDFAIRHQIVEYCRSGWPEKSSLPPELKPYYPVAAELTVQNGLILRGGRMDIPPPMRKDILRKIHTGHQGITKCYERARQSVWWLGLSKQLEGLVHSCEDCLRAQRQRPQPLSPTPLPDLPWQKVASDLFE